MSDEASLSQMVDKGLVYLSLADNLPNRMLPTLMVDKSLCEMVLKLRRRWSLPVEVDARETPDTFHHRWILGSDKCLFELNEASRVPFTTMLRMRSMGAIPRAVTAMANLTFTKIYDNGHTKSEVRAYYQMGAGSFKPAEVPISHRQIHRISGNRETVVAEHALSVESSMPGHLATIVPWMMPRVWSVSVYQPDSPALVLVTDATGAKEMFRLRDKREGMTRRQALLHWVREHWRQCRDDPEEEIKVRQHLRGARQFDWFGLRCDIEPSNEDVMRADELRKARAMDTCARRRTFRKHVPLI